MGLLSPASIPLPEQEPHNLASGRRHHSPKGDVCRRVGPLSREMRRKSHFPCPLQLSVALVDFFSLHTQYLWVPQKWFSSRLGVTVNSRWKKILPYETMSVLRETIEFSLFSHTKLQTPSHMLHPTGRKVLLFQACLQFQWDNARE